MPLPRPADMIQIDDLPPAMKHKTKRRGRPPYVVASLRSIANHLDALRLHVETLADLINEARRVTKTKPKAKGGKR